MQKLGCILLLFFGTIVASTQEEGAAIEIEITHADNDKGQLLIGLYNSDDTWLRKTCMGIFGQLKDGTSSVSFKNVPDGIYAISVFHDEDNDGERNTFFGIPTEDTGSPEVGRCKIQSKRRNGKTGD